MSQPVKATLGEVPLQTYPDYAKEPHEDSLDLDDHVSFDEKFVPEPFVQQQLPSIITCSDVIRWYKEAWQMFLDHWSHYMLFTLLLLFLATGNAIIDALGLHYSIALIFLSISSLSFPLYYGIFIAGMNVMKEKELHLRQETAEGALHDAIKPRTSDFFRGFFIFCPIIGYSIVLNLMTSLGYILLIIPGIYLSVTLSFVPYIYIEYHKQQAYETNEQGLVTYGFCECIGHSVRVIHKHFWEVFFFLILNWAINLLGFISVVGWLVAFPLVSLSMVCAFRDLFQFQMLRSPDERCYCCC